MSEQKLHQFLDSVRSKRGESKYLIAKRAGEGVQGVTQYFNYGTGLSPDKIFNVIKALGLYITDGNGMEWGK
jgi:hypothetical protein